MYGPPFRIHMHTQSTGTYRYHNIGLNGDGAFIKNVNNTESFRNHFSDQYREFLGEIFPKSIKGFANGFNGFTYFLHVVRDEKNRTERREFDYFIFDTEIVVLSIFSYWTWMFVEFYFTLFPIATPWNKYLWSDYAKWRYG